MPQEKNNKVEVEGAVGCTGIWERMSELRDKSREKDDETDEGDL